jgi:hypothetical protein
MKVERMTIRIPICRFARLMCRRLSTKACPWWQPQAQQRVYSAGGSNRSIRVQKAMPDGRLASFSSLVFVSSYMRCYSRLPWGPKTRLSALLTRTVKMNNEASAMPQARMLWLKDLHLTSWRLSSLLRLLRRWCGVLPFVLWQRGSLTREARKLTTTALFLLLGTSGSSGLGGRVW